MKVLTTFELVADVALKKLMAEGYPDLMHYPGRVQTFTVGAEREWEVTINGNPRPKDGQPPFSAYVTFNGFPAGVLTAQEGIIAGGKVANEETFIAALRAELEETP